MLHRRRSALSVYRPVAQPRCVQNLHREYKRRPRRQHRPDKDSDPTLIRPLTVRDILDRMHNTVRLQLFHDPMKLAQQVDHCVQRHDETANGQCLASQRRGRMWVMQPLNDKLQARRGVVTTDSPQ